VWWLTPVIPALGKLRQEDCKVEASLSYRVRPCLKNEWMNDSDFPPQVASVFVWGLGDGRPWRKRP
jgi:hypothetical protein